MLFFTHQVWRDAVRKLEHYGVLYSNGVGLQRQFTADWGRVIKTQKLLVNNHETQRGSEEKRTE